MSQYVSNPIVVHLTEDELGWIINDLREVQRSRLDDFDNAESPIVNWSGGNRRLTHPELTHLVDKRDRLIRKLECHHTDVALVQ